MYIYYVYDLYYIYHVYTIHPTLCILYILCIFIYIRYSPVKTIVCSLLLGQSEALAALSIPQSSSSSPAPRRAAGHGGPGPGAGIRRKPRFPLKGPFKGEIGPYKGIRLFLGLGCY